MTVWVIAYLCWWGSILQPKQLCRDGRKWRVQKSQSWRPVRGSDCEKWLAGWRKCQKHVFLQTNSAIRRFPTLAKMNILVRLMVMRMPKNIISPLKLKCHHPTMIIITVLQNRNPPVEECEANSCNPVSILAKVKSKQASWGLDPDGPHHCRHQQLSLPVYMIFSKQKISITMSSHREAQDWTQI